VLSDLYDNQILTLNQNQIEKLVLKIKKQQTDKMSREWNLHNQNIKGSELAQQAKAESNTSSMSSLKLLDSSIS